MSNGAFASITTSRASTTFSTAPASMSASTAATFASQPSASVTCVTVKLAGARRIGRDVQRGAGVAAGSIDRCATVRPSASRSTMRGGHDHAPAAGERERADRPRPDRLGRAAGSPSCSIAARVATASSGSTTAATPAVTKPRGPSSHARAVGPRWSSRSLGVGEAARCARRAASASGGEAGVGRASRARPGDQLRRAGAERAVRDVDEAGRADHREELGSRREVGRRRGEVRVRAAGRRAGRRRTARPGGTTSRCTARAGALVGSLDVEERDPSPRAQHPRALGEHGARGRRSCAARTRT